MYIYSLCTYLRMFRSVAICLRVVERSVLACRSGPSTASTGLLVDWLSLLHPEILSKSPQLQSQLLFSGGARCESVHSAVSNDSGDLGERREGQQCQQYLVSLVVHQTSWASIQRCLNLLLTDKHAPKRSAFCHLS